MKSGRTKNLKKRRASEENDYCEKRKRRTEIQSLNGKNGNERQVSPSDLFRGFAKQQAYGVFG